MEGAELKRQFWAGRRVLITGHTGFKGSWLALVLSQVGAEVTGFSLDPPTHPSLYEQAGVGEAISSVHGDVVDVEALDRALQDSAAEVLFHLAAQSLVRASYSDPVETFRTNVMGTATVLDAMARAPHVRVGVMVTSDKCYENTGEGIAYAEGSRLGGSDPYSASKAAAELVVASMRPALFPQSESTRIATARGGNVIGAADWAADRLIPDLIRAGMSGTPAAIRFPDAVRPWQHVLDCLDGYITLAERLWTDPKAVGPWNFGPSEERTVRWIADRLSELSDRVSWVEDPGPHLHEAPILRLDSTKAKEGLDWRSRLSVTDALEWTVRGYECVDDRAALRGVLTEQIESYLSLASDRGL